jgi:ATP-dependent Clp protease ATP-binding subunit ClpB
MDFEKFTDRARGFVQSAQSLALREGHQQFATEHLLKVLLDDPEGLAAGLMARSISRPRWRGHSTRPRRWRRRPATAT